MTSNSCQGIAQILMIICMNMKILSLKKIDSPLTIIIMNGMMIQIQQSDLITLTLSLSMDQEPFCHGRKNQDSSP